MLLAIRRRPGCGGYIISADVWLSGRVVDDDLPALVGFFEDEGEDAFGWASLLLVAFEVVLADDYGEVFVKGPDFKVGEGEGAHGGAGGVVAFVLVDQTGVTARDLVGDEEGVGSILVAAC